ncbi:MATE family efflux transporter [Clostridium sp. AM30-24]|nr:MATE family efflux transporter [Clostridium sp. AM30-24]RHT43266.1 MATE family efflux transporter [Clostridium sp. AM30-24]
MAAENDLGRDDIKKLVVRIAIPSMLAQFVSVLYSIVDRMYIGNIPGSGDMALAGAGVCGPVVTMVGSVAFLVGIGGAPLMSMKMGQGDKKAAERILANCFLMLAVCSIFMVACIYPIRIPMLRYFGASDITLPYANAYFTIYLTGTVFALMSTGMNQFIICQGFAKTGMYSVILGAVLNIILDPIFIFGLHMGVSGAAVATVISQMASCAFVLRTLFGKNMPVHITFGGYSWRLIRRVLTIGFTPFIIIAMDNVMIITMNAILQKYGGAERGDLLITCATIAQSFMLVVTMPLGGITSGTQAVLAYNFGAGKTDRVKNAQKYIFSLAAAYTALLFVLARTIGGLFVRLFTSDPIVAAEALRAIRIFTLAIIPLAFQYEIVDGFTGLGQVQVALPLSFFRKGAYFVSLFLLPAMFGAEAAFYAEPVSDILGPIASVIVYLTSMKKVLAKAGAN